MVPLRRTLRALAPLCAAALVVGLAPLGPTGPAEAADSAFAPRLVTVDTPTRGAKQRLQALGLDLTEHAGHDYVEVVLHHAEDLTALRTAGFSYEVRIPDLLARQNANNQVTRKYALSTARSPLPSGRTSYRTLADYNADMAKLARKYPRVARTFELPRPTLDGRTVTGIEVAGNVKRRNDGRPTFALFGLHHAREWPSGELAMEFAMDLAQSYGRSSRITRLLDKARVVVVPVVNADGFDLSRSDGGLVDLRELDRGGTVTILGTPGNAYKRKNCRVVDGEDTPDGTCRIASATSPGGFGVGTDLNRNYGGFWGGPGASANQPDPTYRGAEAFSEPETQNIKDLISRRQVTMMISNHTFSNLVLRPNGVHPETEGPDGRPIGDAPDEKALKELGARMTAQNGYQNIHGWELYDTTGTTEDWSYNATGGFGYTFEIGAHEFHPPYPEVVDEYVGAGRYAGKGNRKAYLIALEHAASRASHGRIVARAPKGATLRVRKSFRTPTWEGSVRDTLESVYRSRGGRLVWHVNPSTRPVNEARRIPRFEERSLRSQTFEGEPGVPTQSTDHEFTLTAKEAAEADVLDVALDWPTPDDLDLEVYRKVGDELVPVGSSGNAPGEKERVQLADPLAGTYVLRVINFASLTPTYQLTADVVSKVTTGTETIPRKVERWTLTCEKKGRVLQELRVRVERGEATSVDLSRCARRF
jgi:murein tripeptide amidase MpaA